MPFYKTLSTKSVKAACGNAKDNVTRCLKRKNNDSTVSGTGNNTVYHHAEAVISFSFAEEPTTPTKHFLREKTSRKFKHAKEGSKSPSSATDAPSPTTQSEHDATPPARGMSSASISPSVAPLRPGKSRKHLPGLLRRRSGNSSGLSGEESNGSPSKTSIKFQPTKRSRRRAAVFTAILSDDDGGSSTATPCEQHASVEREGSERVEQSQAGTARNRNELEQVQTRTVSDGDDSIQKATLSLVREEDGPDEETRLSTIFEGIGGEAEEVEEQEGLGPEFGYTFILHDETVEDNSEAEAFFNCRESFSSEADEMFLNFVELVESKLPEWDGETFMLAKPFVPL
ncbi:hypothetical protein K470DRAFT_294479 [Piedraia hortae CBS 480.64]|uniref:Uncharacterized protein n=1 Tax=Piedraia hortae CBS 480.64 TaxID=1314780 RepID=A0A6A7C1I9_9PEZI|nr:hypothetical protein K470DRAFT_294479 [Piedraia hortae CBS 480.64]